MFQTSARVFGLNPNQTARGIWTSHWRTQNGEVFAGLKLWTSFAVAFQELLNRVLDERYQMMDAATSSQTMGDVESSAAAWADDASAGVA
jgi:hypothetical protein